MQKPRESKKQLDGIERHSGSRIHANLSVKFKINFAKYEIIYVWETGDQSNLNFIYVVCKERYNYFFKVKC